MMDQMITRRAALLGIGAALATPAIVRAESLMRVVAPRLIYPCVGGESRTSIWLVQWGQVTAEIYPSAPDCPLNQAALIMDICKVQARIDRMPLIEPDGTWLINWGASEPARKPRKLVASDWPSRTIKRPDSLKNYRVIT